jgi:hypothetical protein
MEIQDCLFFSSKQHATCCSQHLIALGQARSAWLRLRRREHDLRSACGVSFVTPGIAESIIVHFPNGKSTRESIGNNYVLSFGGFLKQIQVTHSYAIFIGSIADGLMSKAADEF